MKRSAMTVLVLSVILLGGCHTSPAWRSTLDERMAAYGHRNWIVVADSAYPKQSAPGIETVATGAAQLDVLREVLAAVDGAAHVRPVVMLDAELDAVTEQAAPGVGAYRAGLSDLLGEHETRVMPHDDIIRRLDEGSKLFNVLLLKTDLTIPYTSVFIELDCGYWSAEREQALRDAINRR